MIRRMILTLTHALAAALGFAAGIYVLPIVIEPEPPAAAALAAAESAARYTATFRRDLPGSDLLHWGEGEVAIGDAAIALRGEVAPGPDYKVYLSPAAVATAEEFEAVKNRAARIGDLRSFHGFVLPVPPGVDVEQYVAVVIWCETFRRFITAAAYR